AALRVWSAGGSGIGLAAAFGIVLTGKAVPFPAVNWPFQDLVVRPWRTHWRRALTSVVLIVLPSILYIVWLTARGVPRRRSEMEQTRMLVWMADYAREGRFLDIPLRWVSGAAIEGWAVLRGFAVPIAGIAVLALRPRHRAFALPRPIVWH